ncbi:MotB family protein [Pararhizobium sp.]|uniref:MotB family protein n=1 Tax=Pararhizobium sp. TaxID=1977563 RepID=UPI00272091C9|nr:MotB family protein [Pararhizobium sp.]MDO9418245.1 MotB family protein [Pararhizobium sp.]
MSESDSHHGKNEIIIVKRHGGDHGGHHGGAWKIAYADFMTAMMAFFLVMWLINAANEETKASVAAYFNPIKLTDEKPAEKGLKEPAKEAEGENNQQKSKIDGDESKSGGEAETGKDLTSTSGEESKYSEADFFENPYSVLSEIAQEVGQQANISVKGEGGAALAGPATGASGGEAYRDPFDPDFWTKQIEVSNEQNATDASETAAKEDQTPEDQPPAEQQVAMAEPVADDAVLPKETSGKVDPVKEALDAAKEAEIKPDDLPKSEAEKELAAASPEAKTEAEKLKAEISKEISGVAGKLAEGLIVTPAEGGLLISISEQSDAPMFNVGSALPKQDLVLAMEKIGKLLAGRKGAVAIRGHTDARPFKGGGSDNWRLSMSRAQSAYYMLVRGGLDENRVSQVSGFADRRLQVPEDPLAAANRRIEILVQSDKG